jgi:hypothetical protein
MPPLSTAGEDRDTIGPHKIIVLPGESSEILLPSMSFRPDSKTASPGSFLSDPGEETEA